MPKGLLLINLGTPSAPTKAAVRAYLREFLADKRVIDLPFYVRYALLYGIILPFRTPKTTHAYQAIWTPSGSPLLQYSQALTQKLQTYLGDDYQVVLGMRYGTPSLKTALSRLSHCQDLTILPLYPQYSSAATGSSIEACLDILKSNEVYPNLRIIRDFYAQPSFIKAQAELIRPFVYSHDFVLFSYHGLPERHLQKTGCKTICANSCPAINPANQACYRAQCQATTEAIAKNLALPSTHYQMSFQSRLGKTPWIEPYTDKTLPLLRQQGIKRLAIACPSFMVDCLETLEEIGLQANAQWQALGGEQLTLIPCLNDTLAGVQALAELVTT
ncbi:MAG TPA: ferrochelatase [Legionellales bacterium]|nr:ferrochelatase [Legionellales bacterium]|tara:strand:+ start:5777 stop:6766 length:990 start_codon:yes stop_codon:yes gene_type:complete